MQHAKPRRASLTRRVSLLLLVPLWALEYSCGCTRAPPQREAPSPSQLKSVDMLNPTLEIPTLSSSVACAACGAQALDATLRFACLDVLRERTTHTAHPEQQRHPRRVWCPHPERHLIYKPPPLVHTLMPVPAHRRPRSAARQHELTLSNSVTPAACGAHTLNATSPPGRTVMPGRQSVGDAETSSGAGVNTVGLWERGGGTCGGHSRRAGGTDSREIGKAEMQIPALEQA